MSSTGSEERLLTLYADVHYYFGEPGPRPTQHRFDKESYVYLYRDSKSGRGRIEIANHAGTPEQDAFTGFLDNITVHQTFRHPNLCVVTVNGAGKTAQPDNHWRLPSTDPRDEGNYLFRLHTIDLYFWTEADSAQFVHAIASALRQEQLKVDALPVPSPPSHEQPMSPVVQNLENMAISHDGSQKSRSIQTPSSQPQSVSPQADRSPRSSMAKSQRGSAGYTPLAYDPAAPPAPEKHAHREKTPPPPEEEGDGTGLTAAAARDMGRPPMQQSNASFGPTATPSFGPGAPSTIKPPSVHSPVGSPNLYSPMGSPQNGQTYGHNSSNFSPMPSSASTVTQMSPSSRASQGAPSFPGPPARSATEQSMSSVGTADQTPTSEILGPNFRHSGVPLQHLQPQYPDYLAQRVSQNTPPASNTQGYHGPGKVSRDPSVPENVRIGGYSNYNYATPPNQTAAAGYHDANPYQTGDYAIHQTAYRPTEDEVHAHKKNSKHKNEGEARPGRLEQGAEKVEKKVNRFLRGIEKRIG